MMKDLCLRELGTVQTTPGNPSGGNFYAYLKPDGNLYTLDSAGTETILTPSSYEVSGTGTQLLTTTPTIIPLNTVNSANTDFSTAAGVTTYSGPTRNFEVSLKGSGIAVANTRSTSLFSLYLNNTEITRSRARGYHRITGSDGQCTAQSSVILSLSSGDTLEVRASEGQVNDNVNVVLQESNLVFVGQ